MALSSDLISQLVKATKPTETKPTEGTAYGTTVDQNGELYVQLDGSDVLTPVTSTVKLQSGERVIVSIKNHTAVVTGNLTTQSARTDEVDKIVDEITTFEIIIADKVTAEEFDAANGRIDNLISDNVLIRGSLTAVEADISDLEADNVVINEKLTANEASIQNLETTKLSADIADLRYASIDDLEVVNGVIYNLDATYATIDDLNAARAEIGELETGKLSATQADLLYANIDFANIGEAAIRNLFSKSGMIDDLVVSDGQVTGTLVGVTIIGDSIKAGSIQADKLVVRGEDGLYYKLNLEGGATVSEQVTAEELQNGLSGTIIVAKSITAEKVAVDDLVAFGATIGGFHITGNSMYSGVKASVDNVTKGIYQDTDGQLAVGDADNFLKFYTDENGVYRLDISASSMFFATTGKNVEETITEESDRVEGQFAAVNDSINSLDQSLKEKYLKTISEDENGITIKDSKGVYEIQLDNEKGVTIRKNGEVRSQLVDDNFYTGNMVVKVNERAQFGNFAFIPRSDGSLSFLKVGG